MVIGTRRCSACDGKTLSAGVDTAASLKCVFLFFVASWAVQHRTMEWEMGSHLPSIIFLSTAAWRWHITAERRPIISLLVHTTRRGILQMKIKLNWMQFAKTEMSQHKKLQSRPLLASFCVFASNTLRMLFWFFFERRRKIAFLLLPCDLYISTFFFCFDDMLLKEANELRRN